MFGGPCVLAGNIGGSALDDHAKFDGVEEVCMSYRLKCNSSASDESFLSLCLGLKKRFKFGDPGFEKRFKSFLPGLEKRFKYCKQSGGWSLRASRNIFCHASNNGCYNFMCCSWPWVQFVDVHRHIWHAILQPIKIVCHFKFFSFQNWFHYFHNFHNFQKLLGLCDNWKSRWQRGFYVLCKCLPFL